MDSSYTLAVVKYRQLTSLCFSKCALCCINWKQFWGGSVTQKSLRGVAVCFRLSAPYCVAAVQPASQRLLSVQVGQHSDGGPASRLPWSWEGAGPLVSRCSVSHLPTNQLPGFCASQSGQWKMSCSLFFPLGNLITNYALIWLFL